MAELTKCPRCGSRVVQDYRSDVRLHFSDIDFATQNDVAVAMCTRPSCDFSAGALGEKRVQDDDFRALAGRDPKRLEALVEACIVLRETEQAGLDVAAELVVFALNDFLGEGDES